MLPSMRIDDRSFGSPPARIIKSLALLVFVMMTGTVGYMHLEGWTFSDSFYMTVITITTVGFREVRDVSDGGRLFTVVLIFMGMGIIAYTLGMVAQVMVELQLRSILGRRKLGSMIKSLKDHYIICGYGRIGRIIAQELGAKKVPFLVVDNNQESKQALEALGVPYIIDDATSEEVLVEAGIMKARGLVTVVLSDADNLFITMTARGLNPNLFILARADEESTEKKLLRAGATRVVLPYLIGGQKMAQTITKPAVTDFLEFTVHNKDINLEIEQLLVGAGSRLEGLALAESGIRRQMDIIIVAIRKQAGQMLFNPSFESRIEAGDTLIALGQQSELEKLAALLDGDG